MTILKYIYKIKSLTDIIFFLSEFNYATTTIRDFIHNHSAVHYHNVSHFLVCTPFLLITKADTSAFIRV